MGRINTFDIEIQIDEIASIKGDGSDWVNDWDNAEVDDDDADCKPD